MDRSSLLRTDVPTERPVVLIPTLPLSSSLLESISDRLIDAFDALPSDWDRPALSILMQLMRLSLSSSALLLFRVVVLLRGVLLAVSLSSGASCVVADLESMIHCLIGTTTRRHLRFRLNSDSCVQGDCTLCLEKLSL